MAQSNTPARYRARCPACPWTGREFTRYSHAEEAARDHAKRHFHDTHVIDHYGLRIAGSTIRPAEADS
ncbi:DUF6349 family protein [Jiangella aurantiaca]|uniref:DUF6349 family protein n=1 Tax=Jiangella aurantiaca TaxID=2530373 RepID=UPI0013A5ECA4|nr:DUF6349 family protein [Jiangella aurantiaca]